MGGGVYKRHMALSHLFPSYAKSFHCQVGFSLNTFRGDLKS